MIKLFKKKKSEPKLLPKATLNESILGETSVSIASEGPPTIVMPKPRRLTTPTRAILAGFEGDKTQIEESEAEEPRIESAPATVDSHTSEGSSSRAYHSALESLSELSISGPTLDETQAGPRPDSPPRQAPRFLPNPTPPLRVNPIERIKPTLLKQVMQPPKSPVAAVTESKTEEILKELKEKVVQMERQQAMDRAEWQKKEQGLIENHQKMVEKLIETEHQLNEARKKRSSARWQRSKSEERLSRRGSTSSSSHQSPSVTLVPPSRPRAKSIDQKGDPYYYGPKPKKSRSSSSARRTPCSTSYYEDELESDPAGYPPSRYYMQYRAYPYSYQNYPAIYPPTRKYVSRYPVYYDYP